MSRVYKKFSRAAGLAPGELIHVGERKSATTAITVFEFDSENMTERRIASPDDFIPFKDFSGVTWVSVEGIHDVLAVEKICAAFGVHPLVIEDILNTSQRPKTEDYGDYLYVVLKVFSFSEEDGELLTDQVSLILGRGFVLSFEEARHDVMNPVRERLRKKKGRVRTHGADYLVYTLLDTIVDSYTVVTEDMEEDMDLIEEELMGSGSDKVVESIHSMKRALIHMRKSVWPLREAVNLLYRGSSPLITADTRTYMRDLYDHTIFVLDTQETLREILSVMLDVYLTTINNRTNEVMKVLTVLATIFMPLTFLAGVYGMNFRYLPELEMHYGYHIFWVVSFLITAVMIYFFRKKNWL
ncbi:MAG: magnesium/cobalt transporter CorA [Nitrospinae bacterium]|nr:magnesium/cobalt transporter CorA [Nitrospinota bacterium]